MTDDICDYAIVGGGIAAISCAETLTELAPDANILVVSASSTVRRSFASQLTRRLQLVTTSDVTPEELQRDCATVRVRRATVVLLDAKDKKLQLSDGGRVTYRWSVCLCAGGHPRLVLPDHPAVLGIRDTQSVQQFLHRLKHARRVAVIGNGGIASELVFALQNVSVVWLIRDRSISSTFVDPGCAEFLLSRVLDPTCPGRAASTPDEPFKRWTYTAADVGGESDCGGRTVGSALGPDWLQNLCMSGHGSRSLSVEYGVQVSQVHCTEGDWPVSVELTNGRRVDCDFVVSATGVVPNSEPFISGNNLALCPDGGVLVDENMLTSEPSIYAAGDICTPNWQLAPHWFQMRLWSQARQMGDYAARCMHSSSSGTRFMRDLCFDMFAHVTQLFGYKLVLLGLYNGQRLGTKYTAHVRMTPGVEFVKVVVSEGRVQGALLVGETDLEETFENLILSQLDVSHLGDDLLSPQVDLEDYFD